MSILNFIKTLKPEVTHAITWSMTDTFNFHIPDSAKEDIEQAAIDDVLFGIRLAYLRALEESGDATYKENTYIVEFADIAALESQAKTLLQIPQELDFTIVCRFTGTTSSPDFTVKPIFKLPSGVAISHYSLEGPILSFTKKEKYTLSKPLYDAFCAIERHSKLPNKDSYTNNQLLYTLKLCIDQGAKIDIAHFSKIDISTPVKVSVSGEYASNGDLVLTPAFGDDITPDEVKSRIGQINFNSDKAVLKVKEKFVLLNQETIKAAKEILTNRRIPKEQVKLFLECPSAYLDASLIDLDSGLSMRVAGGQRHIKSYFGTLEAIDLGWFADEDACARFETIIPKIEKQEHVDHVISLASDAIESQSPIFEVSGVTYATPTPEQLSNFELATTEILVKIKQLKAAKDEDDDEEAVATGPTVAAIQKNEHVMEFGLLDTINNLPYENVKYSTHNLKRLPLDHQDEGIRWILAHLENPSNSTHSAGALLADDMGLGKTFMTLAAINQYAENQIARGNEFKPCLIVAPLSLLENWETEVELTFKNSPFDDIVILQSDGQLSKYKIKGEPRETIQTYSDKGIDDSSSNEESADELVARIDAADIRYALKVGKAFGFERLDKPRRLVLTTYQTLRDFQFSLATIDWAIVGFDEAQNLKNPNALSTIAAKALKAQFKLPMSATPVENTLKDLWSLMDVAAPGVLGSWAEFHATYVRQITSVDPDDEEQLSFKKMQVGQHLRNRLGTYMLRRTKAQKLKGLPDKIIYTGDPTSEHATYLEYLGSNMTDSQKTIYEKTVNLVADAHRVNKNSASLSALSSLRLISIHPSLSDKSPWPENTKKLIEHAKQSPKMRGMIGALNEIKARDEKVIIFANTKIVQSFTCAIVAALFGITPRILNGETKAVSKKESVLTRKRIVAEFQAKEGFNVVVMSPIAAGVGLTITGANNVIHLERLWNPAKEAQATDRVYRIGQLKLVRVYFPCSLHPDRPSFDQRLGTLIDSKLVLFDSIFTFGDIEPNQLSCAL